MRQFLVVVLVVAAGCSVREPSSSEDLWSDAAAEIDARAKELMAEGRMPLGFGIPATVIGREHGRAGVYRFYPPAFDQAKRSWWIDGVMEAGSDILVPVNQNARFTTWCDVWVSTDGRRSPPCVNTMGSPVGYRIPYLNAHASDGTYAPIRDATVLEMPTYPDGTPKGTLRLDKKAPGFSLTYGIAILPPDYVDMCACHVGYGQ